MHALELRRTFPAQDEPRGRRLSARQGATFAFPAGPWLPAPAQLSSDFSCFLTALTSSGSRSHADLVSSVVLRSVLLWCDSCHPKSAPHHLLPDYLGLQSGLLFTFSLPWIHPPANPRVQVRGISPLFNNSTNCCSPRTQSEFLSPLGPSRTLS